MLYYTAKAMVDTVGENAAKIVLRRAGLLDLLELEEPPEPDETIPLEKALRLKAENMRFFGDTYVAFSRGAGMLAARSMKLPRLVRPILRITTLGGDWRKAMAQVGKRILESLNARVEVDLQEKGYTARVYNCPECRGLRADRPICYFMVGFTTGIIQRLFKIKVDVVERRCIAKGDEYCEFHVLPIE